MAQVRNVSPGHVVVHPNRDKAICKITRVIVVAILLASIALMLVVTIGGWSKLEGMKPVNFIWCLLYLVSAVFIARWARGALPIAASLAILLLIIAVVATFGLSGTSWADRNSYGFGAPQSLFGGSGLTPDALNTFTVLLIPVSLALIVVAMIAFAQGWNVETEMTAEEAQRRGLKAVAVGPDA